MPVGVLTAGATVISGGLAYAGAKKAADAQTKAADKATDVQMKMYETTRGDLQPFRDVGRAATYSLASLYGLPTPENPEGGQPFSQDSLDAFSRSPDYKYAFDEGMRAVEASRASKGLLRSGGTAVELMEKGSGLASQNFGNYVSRLLSLAGIGQSSAAQTGNAAISTGRGVAETTLGAGEAQASGTVAGTNALTGTIGSLTDQFAKLYRPSASAYSSSLPNFSPGVGYTGLY